MKETIKNNKKVFIISIAIILLFLIGVAFAYLTTTIYGEKSYLVRAGSLELRLEEGNELTLEKQIPLEDSEGMKLNGFNFSLINEGKISTDYTIYLDDIELGVGETRMPDTAIRYSLTKNDVVGNASDLSSMGTNPNRVVDKGSVVASKRVNYNLKIWIDYDATTEEASGKTFKAKLRVEAYQERPSKPNAPELDTNMIAVRYNGSDFLKADGSTNSWYNYDKQEWANAVTVSSNTRDKYLEAEVGTKIDMADIETMWVWIPRYSYSIGSEDGTNYYGKQGDYLDSTPTVDLPGEIDIKFVDKTTKDRGTAKYLVSEGPNNWYTPDAFTFGNEELSGIWVGKFETSSSDPSAVNGGANTTSLDPMIKPNVTSWRGITVSNIYKVGLKLSAVGNRYGFSEKMNSHAMRNDEWGAVAYLSQSKYGKLGNENFKGANKEVYQNKSNSYITGCSYGAPNGTSYGCQYIYDVDINGVGASTTGTIYGIYDMNGSAWEYVMGNYNGVAGYSGFSNPLTIDSKYYNKYTSNDAGVACNGRECLSHGLSETGGWYNDFHSMVTETAPWFVRGSGNSNSDDATGVFGFSLNEGDGSYGAFSFRLVMSVTSP